jgi:hypothetical protein
MEKDALLLLTLLGMFVNPVIGAVPLYYYLKESDKDRLEKVINSSEFRKLFKEVTGKDVNDVIINEVAGKDVEDVVNKVYEEAVKQYPQYQRDWMMDYLKFVMGKDVVKEVVHDGKYVKVYRIRDIPPPPE